MTIVLYTLAVIGAFVLLAAIVVAVHWLHDH